MNTEARCGELGGSTMLLVFCGCPADCRYTGGACSLSMESGRKERVRGTELARLIGRSTASVAIALVPVHAHADEALRAGQGPERPFALLGRCPRRPSQTDRPARSLGLPTHDDLHRAFCRGNADRGNDDRRAPRGARCRACRQPGGDGTRPAHRDPSPGLPRLSLPHLPPRHRLRPGQRTFRRPRHLSPMRERSRCGPVCREACG